MPIVTYMLKLSEDELTVLWGLMQVAQLDRSQSQFFPHVRESLAERSKLNLKLDKVDSAIESVTRKVNELMENPSTASAEGSENGGAL